MRCDESSTRIAAVLTALIMSMAPLVSVFAANDAVELERAGIFGSWSLDCGKAAGRGNAFVTVQRDGADQVSWVSDMGEPALRVVYRMEYGHTPGPGLVAMRATAIAGRDIGAVIALVLVVEPDRMRAIDASHSRNGVLILDGIRMGDGKPNPWLYRCPDLKS